MRSNLGIALLAGLAASALSTASMAGPFAQDQTSSFIGGTGGVSPDNSPTAGSAPGNLSYEVGLMGDYYFQLHQLRKKVSHQIAADGGMLTAAHRTSLLQEAETLDMKRPPDAYDYAIAQLRTRILRFVHEDGGRLTAAHAADLQKELDFVNRAYGGPHRGLSGVDLIPGQG
jgi:hypothetical protein